MTMLTETAQWELGYEGPIEPTIADEFGLENRDDLDAIDRYVIGLPQMADSLLAQGKVSESRYKKFQDQFQDWKGFYKFVTASWYVSDSDLAAAKKRRDDMNMLLIPEATKQAQKYSAQATGEKSVKATREGGYEAETKTFLERNWVWIVGGTVVLGAAAYLAGSTLGLLKIAGKATLAGRVAHAVH